MLEIVAIVLLIIKRLVDDSPTIIPTTNNVGAYDNYMILTKKNIHSARLILKQI